jgi:hypothetical protein
LRRSQSNGWRCVKQGGGSDQKNHWSGYTIYLVNTVTKNVLIPTARVATVATSLVLMPDGLLLALAPFVVLAIVMTVLGYIGVVE